MNSTRKRIIEPDVTLAKMAKEIEFERVRIDELFARKDAESDRTAARRHDRLWSTTVGRMTDTPAESIDGVLAKMQALCSMCAGEIEGGATFEELFREQISEQRTTDQCLIYSMLADLAAIISE